jgi:hypothetical protein
MKTISELPAAQPEGEDPCVFAETPDGLAGLIDKLTSLRDPDRRLDARIAALFWPDLCPEYHGFQEGYEGVRLHDAVNEVIVDDYNYLGSIAQIYDIPHFTTDFDEALTLLEDAPFDFSRHPDGSYGIAFGTASGTGAWPAVAVVVAAVRAKGGSE